ncbi:MAG: sulfatase [Verrucomicrobiae bacterium]|nr:sulfatase [Verrucomicrobiae bacterium]
MNPARVTCWLLLLVGGIGSNAVLPLQAAPERPNFIFILVDDLGWTDAGCYGSRFYQTPHLDRLAREGMRFTQAYAACTVCSPTRAAILTGKYPARLHLTDWIAGHARPYARLKPPAWTKYLPAEELTLAEALKPLGYATASIGKWHLGGTNSYPEKHGFDFNLGGTDRGQPPSYFAPYKIATLPDGPAGEYLTDREAAEACRFIEQNRARPFFLYLPHHAVHTPLQAKREVQEQYLARIQPGSRQTNAAYAAMVQSVDDSVGRILDKLAELKLAERTLIFLTSDNGGLVPVTDNSPLRAGKGSAYEGGVRVIAIVKWPGVTPPGSVNDTPIISMDFYPTLLEIAGVPLRPGQRMDGESLVPLLRGTGRLQRTALFWHYPHYHPGGATPYGAIREGDFRLVEFFEDHRLELYDLKNDIGETQNLAAARPELAARLRARLAAWRQEVGAQMPLPNPDYAPDKDRFGAAPPAERRGGG